MTQHEARERVARGAALLDEQVPGWHHKIELSELQLSSSCACIRGQISGGAGWKMLRGVINWDDNKDHGFVCDSAAIVGPEHTRQYQLLQDEWVEQIALRRFADAPIVTWTHREPAGVQL